MGLRCLDRLCTTCCAGERLDWPLRVTTCDVPGLGSTNEVASCEQVWIPTPYCCSRAKISSQITSGQQVTVFSSNRYCSLNPVPQFPTHRGCCEKEVLVMLGHLADSRLLCALLCFGSFLCSLSWRVSSSKR